MNRKVKFKLAAGYCFLFSPLDNIVNYLRLISSRHSQLSMFNLSFIDEKIQVCLQQ